jgi:hypothetical protein
MSGWPKAKPEPASEAASGLALPNPAGDQEPEPHCHCSQEGHPAMDRQLAAVTTDRQRLIAALDTLADIAVAIENNADQHVSLDRDQLITALQGIIGDLTFEIEASNFLG